MIEYIKKSKIPIICISNDEGQKTNIKSLQNSTYNVKFYKPTKQEIADSLMRKVCQPEGLNIDKFALEYLVE